MMKDKRGIGSIVAVSLIILLSVILVASISFIVYKLANPSSLSPEFSCYEMKLSSIVFMQKACYNQTSKNIEVNLQRNFADVIFTHIDFFATIDGRSTEWQCGDQCSTCEIADEGENKNYYFDISELNYSYDGQATIRTKVLDCEIESKQIERC